MIKHIAVAIALSLAPAAFAQTFIVPDKDCGAITLHATHGTDFPNLGETIAADGVRDAYVSTSPSPGMNPGVKPRKVAVKPAAAPRSLDFNTNVDAVDGVVLASVDFTPAVSGNETRTEHAKAMIFCDPTTPMADYQRSNTNGGGIELFPQGWNGPRARLKAGDSMWFILVDKTTKKIIRDVPMELYRAGAGHIADGVPNQVGGSVFPYQEPGWYMVTATYRRPDPEQAEHWLVDTNTLTFEIK